jgi:hypothetical protein
MKIVLTDGEIREALCDLLGHKLDYTPDKDKCRFISRDLGEVAEVERLEFEVEIDDAP